MNPAPSELIRALQDIFDLIEENKVLWQRMGKLAQTDFEFGVAQLGDEIGIDNFKVPPLDAISFLSKRENAMKDVNQRTFKDLTGSLQEGLAAGETYDDLVARVKAVFKTATDERAQSIATTETNIAVNSGRHEAMKTAGVEKKGWRTSRLPGVRATHLENEDYSVEQGGIGLDERWPNGLLYPGDPAGPAGEVINCRCFGYAVVPGKATGKAKLLTFEEFLGRQAPQLTYSASESGTRSEPGDAPKAKMHRGSGVLHSHSGGIHEE